MIKIFFDLGTTNLKYVVEKNEQIIKTENIKNKEIYFDQNNFINANDFFNFFLKIMEENMSEEKEIKVIFSSAMHTLILLDKNYEQIEKGFSLLDSSNFKISEIEKLENRKINGLVNSSFLPIYKIAKIINPNIYTFTTLKSFILLKLYKRNIIEVSDAAGLGMLNFKENEWSFDLFNKYNLQKIKKPELLKENKIFKIKYKNKIINFDLGISDGAAAAIGSELKENEISLSIGTTLGLRIFSKQIDLKYENDYLFPIYNGKYIYGISSQNGGNNIDYILNILNKDYSFINKKNMNNIKISSDAYEKIYFYEERFKTNSKDIKDEEIDESTLKKVIIQLCDRVVEYNEKIEKSLNLDLIIKATGGIFNNIYINDVFMNKLENNIIIFNNDNLSYKGLKIIDNGEFFND
ncbi:hypothetical protein CG006_01615 [Mesoplasma florum]|uniref:FGGY family carbohydrate kinase n=1 Tax=Mesoplasma florum TaxID=2151 RepID=UPI000D0252B1|nr:FGGY family carbohydrate kinase [Mesoplasma florum]AVN63676.1 hypothetical protein CG006_01615 [Mesoplasma florum]